MLLPLGQDPMIGRAEQLAKRRKIAQQRAGGIDEVDQSPQLEQGVLQRRRGEQEDRRSRAAKRL